MRVIRLLLVVPICCLAQESVPVIAFDKKHHDFGMIGPAETVFHRFIVTNMGNAPLKIKNVASSCGCSVASVGKWALAHGESTFVEVKFNPSGMAGHVHKSLQVISDDPKSPNVTLTFEAGIVRDIVLKPPVAFFDDILRSGTASSTMRLESTNGQPIAITSAKIQNAPYLSFSQERDGCDVVFNVFIDGKRIPKKVIAGSDVLTIRTASEYSPEIHFHLHWNLQTAIIANPSRIAWAEEAGTESKSAIVIARKDGRPFKILSVKPSSRLLTTSGISKASAAEHTFLVMLSPKAKAGNYCELLTLRLDCPDQEYFEVSVAAVLW